MKIKAYGTGLAASAAASGILLLLLSWGMYQFRWGNTVLQAGIWASYGLSSLAGGLLVGKKLRNRRFFWGMLMGLLYFFLLLAASCVIHGGVKGGLAEVGAACGICLAGGMLGGMLS